MDGGAAAALALLASFLGLLWGIVCLISPRSAKLPSRWYSLPLMTSFFLFFGLAMIAFPEASESDGQQGGARGAGVVSVLLWALLASLAYLAARNVKLIREKQADPAPSAPTRPNLELVPHPDDERAKGEVAAHLGMAAALKDAPAKRAAPPIRKASPPLEPKIVPDRSGIPKAKSGKWIEFTYADQYGEVTDRHLRNWSRVSKHIEGFCTARREVRTFRIDRVIEWGEWE